MKRDPKLKALREANALHPSPKEVSDQSFREADFFDARDIVQVKYEMLRRVRVDRAPVAQAARAFALSRPTYYEADAAFKSGGLVGLLPRKRGPRRAHKLTKEVMDFVHATVGADPSLDATELVRVVKERFQIAIHRRTIARALARAGK
jgi:transposase